MPNSEAASTQQGNPDGPEFQPPAADPSSLPGMAFQNPHVARQGPEHGGSSAGDARGGQPFQGFDHPAPPGSIGPASWASGASQSPPGPAGEGRPGSEGYVARSELGRELQRASHSINKTARDAERQTQQQPSPPQQRPGPDAEQAELDEMAAGVEAWGDSAPPGAEAGAGGIGAHRQRLDFVGGPGAQAPAKAPAGQPPQQTPGAADSAETAGQPQSQPQAPRPRLSFKDMQPRPAGDALAGQAPRPRLSFKQDRPAASAGGALSLAEPAVLIEMRLLCPVLVPCAAMTGRTCFRKLYTVHQQCHVLVCVSWKGSWQLHVCTRGLLAVGEGRQKRGYDWCPMQGCRVG